MPKNSSSSAITTRFRCKVTGTQLLLASLLQAFYGIRTERLLLEQLHYRLLFRWFVGLSPVDPICQTGC